MKLTLHSLRFGLSFLLSILLLLPLCAGADEMQEEHHGQKERIRKAIALIYPLEGEKVTGIVHFINTRDGVEFEGEFWNLEPGSHGFHIHEYADCTAPNEGSVGEHYLAREHGEGYHGDLPMIEAGAHGHGTVKGTLERLSLIGRHTHIIGRGLLVHGLDGRKIGCGVIGIDN